MRGMGLQGVIRGKPVRTTISDKAAPCPLDHVNRQFQAPRPNALWVSDFTYVSTWTGFVYVAFVIDAYARRIVGWRVSRTAHAELRARCAGAGPARAAAGASRRPRPSQRPRQPIRLDQIHRAPGRSRHRAVGRQRRRHLRQCPRRDDQRPLQGRSHPSARTMADRSKPSSSRRLEWVDWFNNRRLLEPIGNIPPAEAEEHYYAMLSDNQPWRHDLNQIASGNPGAVHFPIAPSPCL